jgi:thioredoxin reductase (NADPH)
MVFSLVIIGAGPAGISMAVEAVNVGVLPEKILILEKAPEHSYTIKKYYPDQKKVTANYKGFKSVCTGVLCLADSSKHETISYLDQAVGTHNLTLHYNETVHQIAREQEDGTFTVRTSGGEYETKLVVIAIGIFGRPNKPEYPLPGALSKKILFDVTSTEIKNSSVLVVGGGDSASEYCQYLYQLGNTMHLSYRKNDFSRMNDINKESIMAMAMRGEVKLLLNSTITAIKDVNGVLEVRFNEEVYGVQTFDYIVYALGGSTPENFLKLLGIEFEGTQPIVKPGYETSVPGMFLVGDLSAGTKGGSINWAFNSTNTAIKRICENYLRSDSQVAKPSLSTTLL